MIEFHDVRRRRVVLAVITAAALVGAGRQAAAAEGVGDFFSQIFGGSQVQSAPQPDGQGYEGPSEDRPLTVRRRSRARFANRHEPVVASVPSKPEKVSIYEDRTLRRGDAVMTARGMRVFAGSQTWPYREGDFVAIADAGRMDKTTRLTLISLDQLPR